MHNLKIALIKIAKTAGLIMGVVTALGIAYGFFSTSGSFTPAYAFVANFAVGGFIITLGVIMFALPARLANKKLVDHSNYAQEMMKAREIKRVKAYDNIYLGIAIVTVTAIIEYLIFLIF